MATRLHVDASRLVSALTFLAVALLVLSLGRFGFGFGMFALAAVVGAAGGFVVYTLRQRRSKPFADHPDETLHLR
ncbi:MAG: hypothetical protein WD690_15645 [Vicinamibacterales bacterium]